MRTKKLYGRTEPMKRPRPGWCRVCYFFPSGRRGHVAVKTEYVEVLGVCEPKYPLDNREQS